MTHQPPRLSESRVRVLAAVQSGRAAPITARGARGSVASALFHLGLIEPVVPAAERPLFADTHRWRVTTAGAAALERAQQHGPFT